MRILAARQADGSGDGGAEGMLIDKPEEGGAIADQSQDGPEEQGDSVSLESAHAARELVPQRKTKQQRRKAEKLRAEVRGQTSPFPLVCPPCDLPIVLMCPKNGTRNVLS